MRYIIRILQDFEATGVTQIEGQNGIVFIVALIVVVVQWERVGLRRCWQILLRVRWEEPHRRVGVDEASEGFKLIQMPWLGHLFQLQVSVVDAHYVLGTQVRLDRFRFIHHYAARFVRIFGRVTIPGTVTLDGPITECRRVVNLGRIGNLFIGSAEKGRQICRLVDGLVHLLGGNLRRGFCVSFARAQADGFKWQEQISVDVLPR